MASSGFFSPSAKSAQADPGAIFLFPTVRFTLLTPRLIRIETSPTGQFEDRPSQVFWYRRQPLPRADIQRTDHDLTIETEVFQLTYHDSLKGLTRHTLQVLIKETGAVIYLDDPNPQRLPGTARTLDETNGPVALQPGLISRAGWVQLDDTPSLVFTPDGWLEERPAQTGYRDLYLLVSGQDYKAALRDFQRVAGAPPLLPRAFLGNWWSRYWEYTQEDIQLLVERFRQEEIPLSVFIIDMDWHITQTGNASSGWTGFSWNRALFPDPPGLSSWLHNHGLITSLNLHPAEGIHPHEERYPQAARALGLDPAREKPIPFDIADPAFAQVYFDQLLHPLEAQGVDFWWIDWQQGEHTTLPNLDPLWWLNHLHFFDRSRDGEKRPIIFSRWGGHGNHRYPIGFSGDTVISWETLAYQPYFTATAANAAYGWWSHDIGGHMRGMEDGELYTRWVQFGVLSPIFRLHCTKDNFIDRLPWAFDAEVLRLTRQAMQFRHALIPYLYTLARRNEREGLPPVTPLYYDWLDEENAYLAGSQYLFGDQLMAAPVTSPVDPDLNQTRQAIWFPPGEWFDFFTGEHFSGPQWQINPYSLAEIPLFARAGAILPLQAETTQNGCSNPNSLDVVVFPGADGSFTLYEDDGVSLNYLQTGGCRTEFTSNWSDSSWSIRIFPAVGDTQSIPQTRSYRILFRGVSLPENLRLRLNGEQADLPTTYDPASRTLTVGPIDATAQQGATVEILAGNGSLLAPAPTIQVRVMRLLKRARMDTVTKWRISTRIAELSRDVTGLADPELILTASHLTALSETFTGAGAIKIALPQGGSRVLLLNPNRLAGFKCRRQTRRITRYQEPLETDDANPIEVDYFGLVKMTL